MKPSLSLSGRTPRLSSLALGASLSLAALALSGCSGVGAIPDTPPITSSAQPGAIQGSVFGGHAPIVGASVYVLQAGTGGYASASKSLITSTSSGASRDASGNYYVTSDANGKFNVTGDYTCTVNTPVYLAAIGGVTSDLIGGPGYSTSPLIITAGKVSSDHSTLTFTANNLLYPNQQVAFNLVTGGNWDSLNGGAYNVLNTTVYPLTTTSFSIVAPTGTTFTGSTSGTATPQSASNPAIANLAVLGNCPSSGNFTTGSAAIKFLYMNEVATTATAYALSGFGSGPFNIGYPGSSALAFTGIQNAANNAAQLYNIQGLYVSSSFAGEGHIANPTTPAGNGIVPQATLDTLGNILAACVDSTNYGNSATNPDSSSNGAPSTSCSKLFTDATSNGIPFSTTGFGTIPTDIATAAFNIAHNPGSGVGSLFTLQGSETTPFAPNLSSAPSDFTIGIQFTNALNPGLASPGSVAVDASGDAWITTAPATGNSLLLDASPLGIDIHTSTATTYDYGDVAIDSAGNAWTADKSPASEPAIEYGPFNSYVAKSPYSVPLTNAQGVAADGSGDVFFAHGTTTESPTLTEIASAGVVAIGTLSDLSGSFTGSDIVSHAATGIPIAGASDIWLVSSNGNTISNVSPVAPASGSLGVGGTAAPSSIAFPITNSTKTSACPSTVASTILTPEQPAIDASGNAWIPLYNAATGSTVLEVTPAGACSTVTVGTGPYGATIDGADNLWVTNFAENTITKFNIPAAISTQAKGNAVSTSTYTLGGTLSAKGVATGGLLSGPEGVATDISGDVIITNYTGNSVVEIIGAASPTYLPLGTAAANTKLGVNP